MQYADEHKYEYCTIDYAFSKSNYLYTIWLYKTWIMVFFVFKFCILASFSDFFFLILSCL